MKTIQLDKEISRLTNAYDKLMKAYYRSCKYGNNSVFPIDANYDLMHQAENISELKYKLIQARELINQYNNETNK
jgi:hypothetical protein